MYRLIVPSILKNYSVALICLLLVSSVRFNRNDLLVSRPLNDAAFYISNVEKLRSYSQTSYPYKGPFNERLAVTTLAALLPFEALTSINIVNLLFLALGCYFLHQLLNLHLRSTNLIWLGTYLFIFSFPTFYYSTIGYVDPSVLAAIFMGTYALYANKKRLFLLAIIVGTLSKENIFILIPVAFVYSLSHNRPQWLSTTLIALVLYLGISYYVKYILLRENASIEAIYWKPSLQRLLWNIKRSHFIASSILSWGIPAILMAWFFIRNPKLILQSFRDDLPLWTGLFCIIAITIYMLSAAFPDGRNVWVAYCFPLLLSLKWYERSKKIEQDAILN